MVYQLSDSDYWEPLVHESAATFCKWNKILQQKYLSHSMGLLGLKVIYLLFFSFYSSLESGGQYIYLFIY
jgi:hypothetical protein